MKKVLYIIIALAIVIAIVGIVWNGDDSSDDFSKDWRTTQSNEYGYSIKTPQGWWVKRVQAEDQFSSMNGVEFSLKNSTQWLDTTTLPGKTVISQGVVTFGDLDFEKFLSKYTIDGNNFEYEYYKITNDENVFVFQIRNLGNKELIFKVLLTLKFIK